MANKVSLLIILTAIFFFATLTDLAKTIALGFLHGVKKRTP